MNKLYKWFDQHPRTKRYTKRFLLSGGVGGFVAMAVPPFNAGRLVVVFVLMAFIILGSD